MKLRDLLSTQQSSNQTQQKFHCETLDSDSFRHKLTFERYPERLFKAENFVTDDNISIIYQKDKENPLNKFFTALFTVDKTDFISLEHYFWFRRMENVSSRDFLCEILSTNDAFKLKHMCQMWAASNTPVVDEGEVSDSEIFDVGSWSKFEQNCSLAAYLVEDLNVIVDGDDFEIKMFKKFVSKWNIPVKLLLSWWLKKNFSKPFWLMDNLHGLSLMKTRQRLIDTYYSNRIDCKTDFLNLIPILRSTSVVDPTSFYMFTDDDLLSWRSKSSSFVVDGIEFLNIFRYYLSKCFELLNLSNEAKYFVDAEDNYDCEKFAEETLKSSNLLFAYENWRIENERRTLIDAIKQCSKYNEKFREELLATNGLVLIYVADDFELSVGMKNKSTFIEFVNDLNLDAETFSMLYVDETCKPKCLGRNLWANLLMEARMEIEQNFSHNGNVGCSVECIFKVESKEKMDSNFVQENLNLRCVKIFFSQLFRFVQCIKNNFPAKSKKKFVRGIVWQNRLHISLNSTWSTKFSSTRSMMPVIKEILFLFWSHFILFSFLFSKNGMFVG